MPKAKPTQVIVHRIELQETEREMLEPFVKAKEVEQYGKTASSIAMAGALGVAVYVGWWTTDAMFGWMNKAGDKLEELKVKIDTYDEQSGGQFSENLKKTSPLARLFLAVNGY
jgi:hypothetical protein